MGKRGAEEVEDGNEAYLKRQKISNSKSTGANTTTEEVRSGRQLRQSLAFDQDAGRAKHGRKSDIILQTIANFLKAFNPSKPFSMHSLPPTQRTVLALPSSPNTSTPKYLQMRKTKLPSS